MLAKKGLVKVCDNLFHRSLATVTTWNALASSFNVAPLKKYNFWSPNVGLFEIPDLSTPDGFLKLKNEATTRSWSLIEKAVKSKPSEETVVLFDELSDTLCRVADMADFVRCAHPNSEFAEAAAEAHLSLGTLVEELNTSKDLYNALKRLTDDPDIKNQLDPETQTVADLFMFDFTISGIHLSSEERQKAVQLHQDLLQLTTDFLQLSNSSIAFSKAHIPNSLHRHFNQQDDNIIVNGFQCDHREESVREASYKLYYYSNPQIEDVLSKLLRIRQEVAQLVGFQSFAERTLKSTIAKTPETVFKFLESLSDQLKPLVENELQSLSSLKASINPSSPQIMAWDLHYYTSKLRATKSSFNPSQFSSYFSLGDCMEGLNCLYQALFNVSVVPVATQKGEVWNDDIVKLAVTSQTDGLLGFIYCDFFNRPGKPQQDCHFTIRGGRRLRDGSYQCPVVVLMLHIASPSFSNPPLLSHGTMSNLFHEMGHAMHSMLGRTRYQHVTGTRCATDFAEVPSVLMEYFVNDPRVVSTFAKHYETREPLSSSKIEAFCQSEKLCSAVEMQTQVFYSISDQTLHGALNLTQNSTTDIVDKIHTKHYSLPLIPNSSFHHRFSHFASYGAKYYSYLMSRAVACRIWKKCFVDDPFNGEKGDRLRKEMLQHGGGRDPVVMYENLLQEKFDTNVLVDTLVDELKSSAL